MRDLDVRVSHLPDDLFVGQRPAVAQYGRDGLPQFVRRPFRDPHVSFDLFQSAPYRFPAQPVAVPGRTEQVSARPVHFGDRPDHFPIVR